MGENPLNVLIFINLSFKLAIHISPDLPIHMQARRCPSCMYSDWGEGSKLLSDIPGSLFPQEQQDQAVKIQLPEPYLPRQQMSGSAHKD